MCLVTRHGIYEMFEYLSSFCNFYAYSHGMKEYVLKILDIIDPDQKYFLKREERVLAPETPDEQATMRENHKRFLDFKDPRNPSQSMFSKAELARTIIVDDQFAAIHESDRGKLSPYFEFNTFHSEPHPE